jgi:hypothetical protein
MTTISIRPLLAGWPRCHDIARRRCVPAQSLVLVVDGKCLIRWLLLSFCRISQANRVTILQEGPLSKRGKVNTGFKRRWFMLTSAGKMLYFKEDNGQCKGDISTVKIQSVSSTGARDFTIHTPERTWVFAAESQEVRDVDIH